MTPKAQSREENIDKSYFIKIKNFSLKDPVKRVKI